MTREEIVAKAQKLAAQGNVAAAKRAMELAGAKAAQSAPQTNSKSLSQIVKENLLGDNDPTTQNMGEKVGTFLNKAGESMTFGLVGDELSTRPEHYRQQEEIFDQQNPVASLAADIGCAMALPGGALKAASKLPLAARMATSGAVGGAGGAVHGFTEADGGNRVSGAQQGAVLGGSLGAAIPVAGAGIQKAIASRANSKAIKAATQNAPSTDELRAAGSAAYKAVDEAGATFKPEAVRNAMLNSLTKMTQGGLDDGAMSLTPKSTRVADIMQETGMRSQPTSFKDLDVLRRKAGTAAGDIGNKLEKKLGTQVIDDIDRFVENAGPDAFAGGNAKQLKSEIIKARELWTRMSKSEIIDDVIENSENYLSGGSSGIRNGFKKVLQSKRLKANFSKEEIKLMRKVQNGSIPEQLINLAGGGLGQLATIGAGGALGGPVGAMLGAGVAAGSRKISENITNRNAEAVRAVIANGGISNLPVASPNSSAIAEQLMRRGAVGLAGR